MREGTDPTVDAVCGVDAGFCYEALDLGRRDGWSGGVGIRNVREIRSRGRDGYSALAGKLAERAWVHCHKRVGDTDRFVLLAESKIAPAQDHGEVTGPEGRGELVCL